MDERFHVVVYKAKSAVYFKGKAMGQQIFLEQSMINLQEKITATAWLFL